jgi:hypothetical protein
MGFKITTFLFALVMISLVSVGFTLFMAEMANEYPAVSYDNTTISSFNKLDDINAQVKVIKDQTNQTSDKSGILDVVGGFFADGYRIMKLTTSSYDTWGEMNEAAMNNSELGDIGHAVNITITSLILIAIFVGIFVSVIVKRDV